MYAGLHIQTWMTISFVLQFGTSISYPPGRSLLYESKKDLVKSRCRQWLAMLSDVAVSVFCYRLDRRW